MNLLQTLVEAAGNQPRFNYFDPVKGHVKGPKHLHPHTGDSFSSSAVELGDLETEILEQLMPIADSMGDDLEFLLPSLLIQGILAFAPIAGVERGHVQRYEIIDMKPYGSEGLSHIVTAKARGHAPKNDHVLYLLNPKRPGLNRDEGGKLAKWIRTNILPPYPANFRMPKSITERWVSYESSLNGRRMTYPILGGDDHDVPLMKGDQFNAILMAYTPGSRYRDFRIFQFTEFGNIGYAKGESSYAIDQNIPSLPYDQLHPNLVYRFEVTGFDKRRKHIFFARPIEVDFRTGLNDPYRNVVHNLTNVVHRDGR